MEMTPKANLVPMVIESDGRGERAFDIYSRLLKDRIIFINGPIHTGMSDIVVAQTLFLAHEDKTKPIYYYINSPGGEISAGMAIHDVMKYVECPIITICTGLAASMGAFLLASGDKRLALPNAEIMIHQPSGGAQGQATDILISARHIEKIRARMNELLAKFTGQPLEVIEQDVERDKWLFADEAKAYGLIDDVLPEAKKAI